MASRLYKSQSSTDIRSLDSSPTHLSLLQGRNATTQRVSEVYYPSNSLKETGGKVCFSVSRVARAHWSRQGALDDKPDNQRTNKINSTLDSLRH